MTEAIFKGQRIILTLLASICFTATSFSQASDFIKVKKRNITIRSYFPGSAIACETVYGNYINGLVHEVKNDSVFVKQYDIRSVPNMWGVAKIDTISVYIVGFHYKDIKFFDVQKRESFGFIRNGAIFMIGGIGYAVLNVINGKYLKESITGPKNRKSLSIALGVAGAGYLMNRVYKYNHDKVHRYKIEYVRMSPLPV